MCLTEAQLIRNQQVVGSSPTPAPKMGLSQQFIR